MSPESGYPGLPPRAWYGLGPMSQGGICEGPLRWNTEVAPNHWAVGGPVKLVRS
jgi:hypothetical protein